MNLQARLLFSMVVALGLVALPQAHSTLVDFNGAGTSEFGSNFIQNGSVYAETSGVGIDGTDGLTNAGDGGALYTTEAFDMTSSTQATASVLFFFKEPIPGQNSVGSRRLASFSILTAPQFDTSRFTLNIWRPGSGGFYPGPNACNFVVRGPSGTNQASFGAGFDLVPGHWYRFTTGFANEDGAFRIFGKVEDYGTDGLQSVSLLSEGSYRNPLVFPATTNLTTVDPVLAGDSSAYFNFSAHAVVSAADNFEFQEGVVVPEPSSTALLACASLFILNRRRPNRRSE